MTKQKHRSKTMRNFISENDIEQAILDKLRAKPFEYDMIVCDADPNKRDDLNDGTARAQERVRAAGGAAPIVVEAESACCEG